MILSYEVTEASVHDSQVFTELLDPNNTRRDVYAGSAHISFQESLAELKEQGFRGHTQRKGCRRGKADIPGSSVATGAERKFDAGSNTSLALWR